MTKISYRTHDLYASINIIKTSKLRRLMSKAYGANGGEKRNVYKFLVGKPKGNRPVGRCRLR
jgi:hypothetical protein